MRRLIPFTAVAATSLVALFTTPALAVGQAEASPTGKGIVGGALLGAEVVTLVEAAIDVEPAWWYIVGGVAGAAGGGVGGYFVEQGGDPKPAMFMLAGGMALAIPTLVAVLSATAYEPPPVADTGPADEPVAEPPQPDAQPQSRIHQPKLRRTTVQRLALTQPPALLGLRQDGHVALRVPAIELRDMYTPVERIQFGVPQRAELRVSLFDVSF
jgi:hypothetical protein